MEIAYYMVTSNLPLGVFKLENHSKFHSFYTFITPVKFVLILLLTSNEIKKSKNNSKKDSKSGNMAAGTYHW